MIFIRMHHGAIAIGVGATEVFNNYRQLEAHTPEAGGVLLGRFIRESNDVIVDVATIPGRTDKAHRFSFHRSRHRTQTLINQAWHDSAGTRNYLGEWHTHPQDDPYPSPVDLMNWYQIARSASYEQESLLFVIVGRTRTRMWEVFRSSGELVQLTALGHENNLPTTSGPNSL